MAVLQSRAARVGPAANIYWLAYFLVSFSVLIVLYLDPHFNSPSGLISLDTFTHKPVRHGNDPCSWDYEGSWKIGSMYGSNPTQLNISIQPVINCADVMTSSVSFVAAPFVHVPADVERLDGSTWTAFFEMRNLESYSSEIGVAVSRDGGATWEQQGTALVEPGESLTSPFVVYDAASQLYVMLPDVRSSRSPDGLLVYTTTPEEFPFGWRRLEQHHPHHPGHGPHDSDGESRHMHHQHEGGRQLMQKAHAGEGEPHHGRSHDGGPEHDGPGSGSPWGPPPNRGRYQDTVAVLHQGRWWIFTTLYQSRLLPWLPPRPTALIFTTTGSLLSPWRQHPASAPSGGWGRGRASVVEAGAWASGGGGGSEWLRPAGRPLVWRDTLHRWVHRCRGSQCSQELVLMAATAANETHFAERQAASYAPGDVQDQSWHAQRLGHVDVWPVVAPRGTTAAAADTDGATGGRSDVISGSQEPQQWVGLVSGDRYPNGLHHFRVHEAWFVELKGQLRNLVAAQLVLVLTALAVHMSSSSAASVAALGSSRTPPDSKGACTAKGRLFLPGGHPGVGGKEGKEDVCGGLTADAECYRVLPVGGPLPGRGGLPAVTWALVWAERVVRAVQVGLARAAAAWETVEAAGRRVAAQPCVQFAAHALAVYGAGLAVALGAMVLVPSAVPCPRWTVVVRPFPSSPHYVPPQPFVDPAAPFDVSRLTLVSGCTMSFMDRLENLVGSLQYWEPDSPILLYDLGFTSEQLAEVGCWRGVSVVRFPYEDYPAHVREIGNYAFKPLVFQHAMRASGGPVLWVDCGLEVRAPLDSMRQTLSRTGHVSAQQSMAPADFPYTEQYTLPFFGEERFPRQEYERVKNLPFCAGGLNGFVPGAAAERLILQPAVDCALDPNCISPPGHTQKKHMYDQTAFTLHIRRYNFSSCMPRETHCTSAVKKVSYDPTASSDPIVVASRRHRHPKPYLQRVVRQPGCTADPAANPWRSVSSEHPETVAKSSSLLFKLGFVYGQALGDLLIQAGCCLGFHLLAQSAVAAVLLFGGAYRYLASRAAPLGPQLPPHHIGAAGAAGPCCQRLWLWVGRPGPLLAGLAGLMGTMALSLGTTCRAV